MKRIMTVATVVVLLYAVDGLSAAVAQKTDTSTNLRRIQVNARTITRLPKTKKYVVDLTKRGVKYEFDSKAGQINFSRVVVRTAQGDLAIATFLEKNFSIEILSEFKLNSHSFSIGTRPADTVPSVDQGATEARLGFSCGSISCDCVGDYDCGNLIFRSGRCGSSIFCWIGDDGKTHCHCRQHP